MLDSEILKRAIDDGIIDLTTIKQNIAMNERRKYLSEHPYSVYEGSDEKWYSYLPSEDGKRKKIKRNTRKELEDIIVTYYKEHEVRVTIDDMFESWLESKVRHGEIKPATVDKYRTDYDKYIKNSILSDRPIYMIDAYELEDFIKATIYENQLSSKSYSGIRTIIIGVFKHAKKLGETDISISTFFGDLELSRKAFKKKRVKSEDQIFTDKEVGMIEEYIMSTKFSFVNQAILFAFYTGLRAGEIVALKKSDIHEGYVEVHSTEIHYKGQNGKQIYEIQNCPKTDSGYRKVYLTNEAKYIADRMIHHEKLQDTDFLFINDELTTIHGHTLTNKLYRICDKVEINRRSLHKCRKTFATKLITNNVSKKVIQEQMGHSDIKTTESYYFFNNLDDEDTCREVLRAIVY